MKTYRALSPASSERLYLLMEEMAESIQVIGKILRHGYKSYHPDNPHEDNRELLEKELGHVMCAQQMLHDSVEINLDRISRHAAEKQLMVGQYLHHQPTIRGRKD